MANLAMTDYIVTGPKKELDELWKVMNDLDVNGKTVWLYKFADKFGIDYHNKVKPISVRGEFVFAEYCDYADVPYIQFETETAWDACNDLFFAVNEKMNNKLSISYRCCECGCQIFYTHDEGGYYPDECCVTSNGDVFGEMGFYEMFQTVDNAIDYWCECMEYDRGNKTTDEMLKIIDEYEYDDDCLYYHIHKFIFE